MFTILLSQKTYSKFLPLNGSLKLELLNLGQIKGTEWSNFLQKVMYLNLNEAIMQI